MSKVQNILIEASSNARREKFKSYKNIGFNDVWSGFSYLDDNSDAFINSKGINFEDYVGCKTLTGNELFYYPELAEKICEIKEYPTLKRSYAVDCEIRGMDFIEYFCKFVRESFNNFEADLITASSIADNLIDLYGNKQQTPIINCMTTEPDGRNIVLTINGVKWQVNNSRYNKFKMTEHIDLYRLLEFSRTEFTRIEVEKIIPETPFIAIRIAKNWALKGRVYWYSLATRKVVSKMEMGRWGKPR